jgi:hypothetical protein
MLRSLRLLAGVAVIAVAVVPACDADVTESCTNGPCGGGVTSSSSATGTDAANCPSTPQTGDFPCDVFAVVHHNCNPCHQNPPLNGAPFPLLVYADTQKVYSPTELVFQQMFISTGPNGSPRMPFGGMLTPTDYDLLHGWLAQCAPPVPSGTGCGCPGMGCD